MGQALIAARDGVAAVAAVFLDDNGPGFDRQAVHGLVGDENTFMVPITTNLSVRQLAAMQEVGQQPGVPFLITQTGATRNPGNVLRMSHVENLISLKRGSVRIVDEGSGKFSLSFVYDALTAAYATVHFGARDMSSVTAVR